MAYEVSVAASVTAWRNVARNRRNVIGSVTVPSMTSIEGKRMLAATKFYSQ